MPNENEDDFDSLYGSKYLSVADLKDREPRVTIKSVEVAELRDKVGATKRKYVVWFEGANKALVINRTNAKKLADAYGKQNSNWIGQIVTLYAEDTSFGKGVRVRPVQRAATKPVAKTAELESDSVPF
jgi:hypothetical protein